MPWLNVQRWIVCFCSPGSHLRELFAEESLTTFAGYLLEHQHSASLLIYSHSQAPSTSSPGGDACLPRNTLKSSEFKSSSRRSLRAPCRHSWSFTQIPVPQGLPHNAGASWQCIKLDGREKMRDGGKGTRCRHCKYMLIICWERTQIAHLPTLTGVLSHMLVCCQGQNGHKACTILTKPKFFAVKAVKHDRWIKDNLKVQFRVGEWWYL